MQDTKEDISGITYDSFQEFQEKGFGRCQHREMGKLESFNLARTLNHFRDTIRKDDRRLYKSKVRCKLWFIHVTDGINGRIAPEQRIEQVRLLQQAFEPHDIYLEYNEDSYCEVGDKDAYRMGYGSSQEVYIKSKYNKDPDKYINIVTSDLDAGLLGWAGNFPHEYLANKHRDGVVLHYKTLPGNEGRYGKGGTAKHEFGHLFGLEHTFSHGCSKRGDLVSDTPPQCKPHYGIPRIGEHYCNPKDSNLRPTNIMDYLDDFQLLEFTKEQAVRMREQMRLYRRGMVVS